MYGERTSKYQQAYLSPKMEECEMQKKLSHLAVATVLALALLVPASQAFAAVSDTVSITVTISATVSVDIAEGSYDFGSLAIGATQTSASSLTLTNDGSGIDETYSLNCSDTADWTAGSSPAADTFVLSAQFNSVAPASFDAVNDVLSTTPVAASGTLFAGDETGASVPYNEVRNLWLQIQTPTTTAATAQQAITLTVTAAAS
jgi:hypothetical protein